MKDPEPRIASDWSGSPTVKSKNAVQRAVTALLDELAPERVLKRAERLPLPVEQHRTPTGCVLQAPTAAISVSWFADAAKGAPLGELHVVVWRGTVARRGATRNQKGPRSSRNTSCCPSSLRQPNACGRRLMARSTIPPRWLPGASLFWNRRSGA
jgi:hypothetical protein